MPKLFVSYSRKDSVAARKLVESFKSIDLEVWVDWEDIPLAAEWLNQIFTGIEEADVFIFLISPDSVASEVCKVEINKAVENNKRIIPIVLRDLTDARLAPESIGKLNWTYIRETDNFEEGLAKVKTAIDLDLDWLEEHRRLQVRALEWHRKKDTSLLLRGKDLRNARRMLQTYTSKDPIPTELQQKYIEYSYRRERTRRIMWGVTGVTLVILTALTLYAARQTEIANEARQEEFQQRVTAQVAATDANEQRILADYSAATARSAEALARENEALAKVNENLAQAQRSAARAQIYQSRPGELYTSTLLGIDSLFRNPTSDEAEEILRTNLSLLPRPVTQVAMEKKINAVAYNPKGETFATAGDDGSTCIWNVKTGAEIFCTAAGGPSVNAVAFDPAGTLVITGDQSGRVQILDPENKEVKYTAYRVKPETGNIVDVDVVPGNGKSNQEILEIPVRAVSFRPPNGSLVSVAYEDGQFPLFDPNTGNIPIRLFTGTRPNAFGISPNGIFLAVGSDDGNATIWNLNTDQKVPTITHRGGVLALAFSSDNRTVAIGGNDNSVSLIGLIQGQEPVRILTQGPVRDLVFIPNSKRLVTASDNQIRIWDPFGREQLRMSQDGTVADLAISPNGRWIASLGEDRTARVWDAVTGAEMFQTPVETGGTSLAFSSDDQSLITTEQSGAINIWDLSSLEARVESIPFDGIVDQVKISPSGDWAAVSDNTRVWLLQPKAGLIQKLQGNPKEFNSNIKNMAFSPDSKYLGISTDSDGPQLYDFTQRRWTETELPLLVKSIAFSPDNKLFLASDLDGVVRAWDIASSQLEDSEWEYPQSPSLASSSATLALGLKDRIDLGLNGMGEDSQLEAPGENTLLALNENGSWLASTDSSGVIHIWNKRDGEFMNVLSAENGDGASALSTEQAASLAFSPDGRILAIGTGDKVILIDTASSDEIARIPHRGVVRSVTFSPDGLYLTTASSNFLQQWDVSKIDRIDSADLLQEACFRLVKNFSDDQLKDLFGNDPYKNPCEG